MTAFVDASVLVAIVAGEPDYEQLALDVMKDNVVLWSAMSCWETITGLCSSHNYELSRACREVEDFAAARPLRLVEIGEAERRVALDAYQLYGRRSRHPALLNMGDCFSYACAKTNNARLLYKGDDFAHTDLA